MKRRDVARINKTYASVLGKGTGFKFTKKHRCPTMWYVKEAAQFLNQEILMNGKKLRMKVSWYKEKENGDIRGIVIEETKKEQTWVC